jgi:hypothetical protein
VLFNIMMASLEQESKPLQMTTYKEFSTLFNRQILFMQRLLHRVLKILVFLHQAVGNGVRDKMVLGRIVRSLQKQLTILLLVITIQQISLKKQLKSKYLMVTIESKNFKVLVGSMLKHQSFATNKRKKLILPLI